MELMKKIWLLIFARPKIWDEVEMFYKEDIEWDFCVSNHMNNQCYRFIYEIANVHDITHSPWNHCGLPIWIVLKLNGLICMIMFNEWTYNHNANYRTSCLLSRQLWILLARWYTTTVPHIIVFFSLFDALNDNHETSLLQVQVYAAPDVLVKSLLSSDKIYS